MQLVAKFCLQFEVYHIAFFRSTKRMHLTLKLQCQVVADEGVSLLLTRRLVAKKECSVNQVLLHFCMDIVIKKQWICSTGM